MATALAMTMVDPAARLAPATSLAIAMAALTTSPAMATAVCMAMVAPAACLALATELAYGAFPQHWLWQW